MTLTEFTEIMKKELRAFEEFWTRNQTADPENFPSDLPEEDWWNQYLAHGCLEKEKEDAQSH